MKRDELRWQRSNLMYKFIKEVCIEPSANRRQRERSKACCTGIGALEEGFGVQKDRTGA